MNETQHCDASQWPSPSYAWYVVGVLTFASMVSFVDRQILTLLIEPIKQDLGISDTQVSLLGGLAFAIFYTIMAMPIAWLADQRSRRLIIAVGVAVWSLMTAFGGLSKTYSQLFLARVGVGVGEASLTPAAFSMIADYFPPRRLGRAIGVYSTGMTLGAGLALVVGGAVLELVTELPQIVLPLIGAVRPWQLAFFSVSLPGILVIALMMTVREPFRRGRMHIQGEEHGEKDAIPLRAAITFTAAHWKTYVPLFAGFAITALMGYAVMVWTPTLYIRTYGWTASSIGYAYGMIMLAFGPLGAIGGGWIADKLSRRGHQDAALRVTIVVVVLIAPAAILMPLMPTAISSLVLLAILSALLMAFGALVPTAFQLVTPNRLRAQVTAFSMLIVNLLGIGLGPTVVALITDYGFGDDMALRYSISIVAAVFAPLGALIFWSGLNSYRVDVTAAMNGAGGMD